MRVFRCRNGRAALAIGAAALFFMLSGCGGQVTALPPEGPETTAPVTITISSDTTRDAVARGVAKDASGFADTRLDGGGVSGVGDEAVDVICDLTFGHAARIGNAMTSTGIEIRDLNDPGIAACANASKCVTCQNEYKTWDDIALAWVPDPSLSHCVGTCSGVVPANMATEADLLQIFSHFYATVESNIPDIDLAAILYQGWVENWPALDISDVLGTPGPYEQLVLDPTGDFTFAFDQDPFTTHGLLTRDVVNLADWTRGIDITDLDPTPTGGVGSGKFHAQHLAEMPFTGAMAGAVDLSAGPLSVAITLCDDVHSCSMVVEDFVLWNLRDADANAIANNAVDVRAPLDFVFEEAMDPNTLFNGTILVSIPGAPQQLPQPEFSVLPVDGSGNTAFDLAFTMNQTESYLYQGLPMQVMVTNNALSAVQTPAAAATINFTLAAAASDGFVGDTHNNYDFHKIIPIDPWAETEGSYDNAHPYVDFGSANWENRCLVFNDAAKDEVDIPQVTIWPTKDLTAQLKSVIEIDLKDIANLKNIELAKDRDADLIGLRIADATSGKFLFIGVRAARAADGGVIPLCEVFLFDPSVNPPNRNDEPPIGDITYGSWRDCSGVSNANFAIQANLETHLLMAWMVENPTENSSIYERMDGDNYNSYRADGDKSLPGNALPRDGVGKSAVGVLFNSSAGNTRDLTASLVKLVMYGWAAEGLSWEPVPGCGTPGTPCY